MGLILSGGAYGPARRELLGRIPQLFPLANTPLLFYALETIRKYQAEKGRWQDDRAAHQATSTAVRDLVAMLDDKSPEVRSRAVRGLGALGAIDELPRVVQMLKDSDDGVRNAASEVLKTLGAPAEKKD